ncbi:MAG: 4Fe-4S binding protein [Candidatus Eisenbacteria bacterium]|nr:4Fe-4S binding protein [Candidatus Eisenbacteria bacterium]
MSARARARKIIWIRRIVQAAFFVLFAWLLLGTRASEGAPAPGRLRFFFDLDPLVQIATVLSSRSLAAFAFPALITLVVTVLLGRVFCGWVCPFGALHNAVGWLGRRFRRRPAPAGERFSRWQRAKYYVLFGLLAAALLGAGWVGVLDPFSMLYRSTVTTVLPALQYAVADGSTAVYRADPRAGPLHLTSITEPAYRFMRDGVFVAARQVFTGGGLIFLLFLGALLANLVRPRFWCRYLCPLGALLGLVARRPALRLVSDEKACVACGRCAAACPAAAEPDRMGGWRASECYGCWNCVGACAPGAIDFRFGIPFRPFPSAGTDLGRRAALASLAGGAGAFLTLRLPPQAQGKTFNPELIRPPGARAEREFLQRCVQCGLCMKICPTNALQPTLFEAGLEGIWTPRLVPRIGYCEYECFRCGHVCPTGAIRPLAAEEKKETKIGLAAIDTTRCLPYAYGKNCIVCEEHCPLPEKAIWFVEAEVPQRDGSTRILKQPKVDPDLCIGCGICEAKCPFTDRPAIRVTSANETRHPENQPILPGESGFDWGAGGGAYGGD